MSEPPLPSEAVEMLSKANPAVITTLRSDGQPVSTATWYLFENGQVLVNMDEGRKRLQHVRRDPRVTLTVLSDEDWYTHVSLIGEVVDLTEDRGLADIDALAGHYLGKPYPQRDRRRYSARIRIDRWHGWGAMKDSGRPG